jgi:hypothetical protein
MKLFLNFSKLLCCLFVMNATATKAEEYMSCQSNPEMLKKSSQRLQELEKKDQDDRNSGLSWEIILKKDRERRIEVATVFARGCMSTKEDYSNAALIFQHGDLDFPDHFFQAFLFAKRAVELGSTTDKDMMANGIDRYLINKGRKQLFGSQALLPKGETCYCLAQVESSFPDSLRVEYKAKTYLQELEWVSAINQSMGLNCSLAKECTSELRPSPAGTVPGFW